ncbi:hypothetical protein PSN45_002200 [Yamadazyma tenuis]|nr:hypothetical protein PSN45_002200 [Yamadazyma tenuis]
MAEPIQTPTKPVPPTTDLARFSIGDRSVRSKSDPTDHPGAEVSTHPPTCHRSRSSSPHFTSNPQPNSSNSHPNSHPHVTVNLHPARRLRQPRLSIQKFHETFSSTFYKRNKNGYMFIRETNDDLIKIDDSTLNLTVRLGNVSREVSINTNTMKDFELVNDFKFIKRKSVSRRH